MKQTCLKTNHDRHHSPTRQPTHPHTHPPPHTPPHPPPTNIFPSAMHLQWARFQLFPDGEHKMNWQLLVEEPMFECVGGVGGQLQANL